MRPWMIMLFAACSGGPAPVGQDSPAAPQDTSPIDSGEAPLPDLTPVAVVVTLDGAPAAGVVVRQGGADSAWTTDDDGRAEITFDTTVPGDLIITAAHPEARLGLAEFGHQSLPRTV